MLTDFPNPERRGCPPPEIVKKIAFSRLSLEGAEPYLDHLSACSPCRQDYVRLLKLRSWQRRKNVVLAVAASIVLVFGLAWFAVRWRSQQLIAQIAVVDLRDVPRGPEPLDLTGRMGTIRIYLPQGSEGAIYHLRIVDASGNPVVDRTEEARLQDGVARIEVKVDLSSAAPGRLELDVSGPNLPVTAYPLRVN